MNDLETVAYIIRDGKAELEEIITMYKQTEPYNTMADLLESMDDAVSELDRTLSLLNELADQLTYHEWDVYHEAPDMSSHSEYPDSYDNIRGE